MKSLIHAGICMMLFLASAKGSWGFSYEFEFDQKSLEIISDQYGDLLKLDGCNMKGAPGNPFIPVKTGHIAVSFGARITDIRVIDEKWSSLPGNYDIRPAPTPVPVSYDGPMPEVVRNKAVYSSDNPYPPDAFIFTGEGMMRGYSLGSFEIFPLRYYPASGQVEILERLVVQVEFNASYSPFSPTIEFSNVVSMLVENPSVIQDQPIILSPIDPNDVKYLIITSSGLVSSFQPLAEWYTQSGWPAEIVTLTYIQSNYSGATDQLKIKACIQDYAVNKGTIFVLIGGDDTIIPDQNCWGDVNNGGTTDNTIPTDLFYACHDNTFNWNSDGDNQVGEYNDGIDLYPEVFISRAPVRTTTHTTNFVNKTLNYIKSQPASGFIDPMLLSGVELWQTWGGRSDADWRCEKLWNDYVSPYWSGHSRVRFYDTNTDFGGAGHDVTYQNLSDKFNDGYKYFFMATHGNQTIWGMETGSYFSSSHASALTNSNEEGTIYTIACITNAFDLEGGYTSDPCLSEAFIRNGNGGAVVYQGCSRYGWGWNQQSDEHGPSFQYADEFYYYLFTGNSTGVPTGYPYRMGAVAASHKAAKVPECYSEGASSVMRWINYGTNSIGDPGMDLFTENPLTLNPDYNETVPVGHSDFSITGLPSEARVCLWKDSEVYAVGMEASGGVILSINPTSTGVMYVTITAHNHWPHIDSVDVISSGPYVIYDFHTINDFSGNNDGLVNNGESIISGIQLKNTGTEDAHDVTATLSTSDSYISITDNTEPYGTINANGGTAYHEDAFSFDVAGDIPDGHTIHFELTVTGTALDTWDSDFFITAHTPVVEYLSVTINDYMGNGNGILDPSETADLIVTLENTGTAQASSVTGILSESDPYINISDNYGSFGDIASDGGNGDNFGDVFVVSADGSCPMGYEMTFNLAISAGGDYSTNLNFDLMIGDKMAFFSDDFSYNQGWTGLSGNGEWTIGPATGGSGSDNYGGPDPSIDHSPSSDNQVLGNDLNSGTGGDYNASLSTTYWVTSPVIDCSDYTEVTLTYYRWLGVERNLYDHAYFQVYDGSSWITLFENPSSHIDESSWNEQAYDISAMADSNSNFQIRFGIGTTDVAWQYCGWNIDDLSLEGYYHSTVENPVISYSPTSITDSLSPGHQEINYLTVYNTGTATLEATFTTLQSWIYFNGGPYYISPQDSVVIDITLDADGLAPGNHTGSIDFSCNDPVTPNGSIPASLYVYDPDITAEPTAITDTLIVEQAIIRYIVLQNTGEGVLDYTVSFQTFNLLGLGTPTSKKTETGLISFQTINKNATQNDELVKAVIDDLTLETTDDWLNVTPLSGSINAGEIDSLTVTLDATGQIAGIYTGQISIASNDYDTPNIDVPVTMVVEEPPEPDISFSPTAVSDSLHQDSLSVHDIMIYNSGLGILSVSFSTEQTWIQFDGGPYYVDPEDSATLQVTLDATGLPPADYNGSINFTSNDPDTPSGNIPVSLHVFAPDISFSPTAVSDSLHQDSLSIQDIMIYNSGLGILSVSFNTEQPWIQFDGGPYYVDPEDSATLQVTLDATGLPPADYNGSINFTSNDPDTPSGNIPVSLHVFAPDISFLPTAISDSLHQDSLSVHDIMIYNSGLGILSVSFNTEQPWIQFDGGPYYVAPEDSATLQVTLDATGLPPADYNGSINFTSNDPDTPSGNIPVSLHVFAPDISFLPTAVSDSLHQDSLSVHDIMIYNSGLGILSVSFSTEQSWIQFDGGPYYVDPEDSTTFQVTLDATGLPPADYNGSINFTSNDPDTPSGNIPVSLHVYEPDISVNPTAVNDTLEQGQQSIHYIYIENNGPGWLNYTISYQTTYLFSPGDGSVLSEKIDIPSAESNRRNQSDTERINLSSTSDQNMQTIYNAEFISDDTPIELLVPTWLTVSPLSGSVEPGGRDSLEVVFDAVDLDEGEYTSEITISSNDPDSPNIYIPVSLVVEVLQFAIIELNVDAIYDTVLAGNTTDFELLITNVGTLDLNYDITDDQIWIEEDPASGVVEPSATDTVTITFDATTLDVGTYTGVITVSSNDQTQPQIDIPVELEVTAIPNIHLSAYSFNDTVSGGDILIRELIISNSGNGTLTYNISDDRNWLSEDPESGQVEPGGEQDTIDIIFNATNLYPGTYDGTITVNSNDPDSSVIDIPVLLFVLYPGGCDYVPGDANGDGSCLGTDVTYSVRYFKGLGSPPPDSCWNESTVSWLYSGGDANGNCSFTGSDVTFLVAYFQGQQPAILWCPQTPPLNPPVLLGNDKNIIPMLKPKD